MSLRDRLGLDSPKSERPVVEQRIERLPVDRRPEWVKRMNDGRHIPIGIAR